jgi:hypothetical protein
MRVMYACFVLNDAKNVCGNVLVALTEKHPREF